MTMLLTPGTKLGPYEILAPIGAAELSSSPIVVVLKWTALLEKQ